MSKTKIEWAETVWNPVVGCSKVSQGCKNCYAETMAKRLKAMGRPEYQDVIGVDGRWNGTVQLVKERLEDPLRWKKPRRVFVNSMSDLFHEDVPEHFIASVFGAMALCQQHTFMILTKRPKRAADWFQDIGGTTRRSWVLLSAARLINANRIKFPDWPLPNVWLGVSVEDQKTADKRIPMLLQTPAAVRFVSYEPALGPVDFMGINGALNSWFKNGEIDVVREGNLDWIIMGGESGPGARPMHPDWARSVRDQCQEAGVKFFFKQWGEWVTAVIEDDPKFVGGRAFNNPTGGRSAAIITTKSPGLFQKRPLRSLEPGDETQGGLKMLDKDTIAIRVGKKAAGRMLDGQEWSQYPEVTK